MFLEDGAGTGYKVKVDSDNRLSVDAVQATKMATVSREEGLSFVFASGDFIAITTTGTETGILHIKNTSTTKNLRIDSIRTCADVINKWKLYVNSTGGTLISDQSAGTKNNLNTASSKAAEATVYKGADAKTVTGGTMLEHWINDVGHSTEQFFGALIIKPLDSLELSLEVASAGDICCRVIGYYEDV